MSEKQPITLTAEQVIALVGHGATQEQLDGVRRELNQRIDRVEARIDKVEEKIDKRFEKMDSKLDRLQWFIVAAALALIFKDYLFKLAGA